MKNILSFVMLLCFVNTFCQEKLQIEYEFRNEFDIENAKDSVVKERLKNSNENRLYFELLSSDKESLFQRIDRIDNSQGRSGVSISFISGPGGIYYKNLVEKSTLSQVNYNGKKMLITDSITTKNWILGKDKDKILGFDVKKATLQVSENSFVEAWYAPKLNYRNGPSNYEGLPGIILKLILTNKEENSVNKQIYLATKVELNERLKIEKPTNGKSITQVEFDEMMKEEERKFNELFKQ